MQESPEAAGPSGPPGPVAAPVSLAQLLLLFARIGLTSFGGGLSAWLYREVVDRRGWLSEDEFLGAMTMSQILPGANVVNLSIYVGQRLRGALGSLIAVASLLLPPMVIAVLLSVVFQRLGNIVWLHDFLEGLAAAAIGLSTSVGLRGVRRALQDSLWPIVPMVAIFISIGLLRWPLVPVVLVLGAGSLALSWKKL